MNSSQIKKALKEIEHLNRSRELREIFITKGVKFYDKKGWGYIKNGVKIYTEYNMPLPEPSTDGIQAAPSI